MTKELNLNISERYAARALLAGFKGDLGTLAFILDDLKALAISDEEWKAAQLTKTPSDEEVAALTPEERKSVVQNWKWEDEGSEKNFTLSQEGVDFLTKDIKAKSESGEFTVADAKVLMLNKKLTA